MYRNKGKFDLTNVILKVSLFPLNLNLDNFKGLWCQHGPTYEPMTFSGRFAVNQAP